MKNIQVKTGYANVNGARLYYETAGMGTPLVMIHAGVADCRQWNNEFEKFAENHQVVRYDLRGYGKSEPTDGEFSHMDDLLAILETLNLHQPLILMGCSMGGGLAMDFALANPSRMKALIMVDSGPSGLDLDVEIPAKFAEVEKAFAAGDLDQAAELETQIWFDGIGRNPDQVNQGMRKLAYEMDRKAISNQAKQTGKPTPNRKTPAFDHLQELKIPVLIIVGEHDNDYIWGAADYMVHKLPSWRWVGIEDAAHLPNMDHPRSFQGVVADFLDGLTG
jgi:pimeloyl-ACP methyl ester carboxylesterase